MPPQPGRIEELGLRESATPARDLPGWRRPAKVVAWLDRPDRLPVLQAVAPGVEIVLAASVEEATRAAPGAQALLGFCEQEILAQAPQLHWVQVYWAGVEDCVTHPGMRQGAKVLTKGQAIASPALAEHAIALILALVRGLDRYHANQLVGSWQDDVGLSHADFIELAGRTALVVGLGGIGTQTAKRAHALGMRVIATRSSRREGPDYVDYVGLADETLELARQADVVINIHAVDRPHPRPVQCRLLQSHEANRVLHLSGPRRQHRYRRSRRRAAAVRSPAPASM